MVRQLPSLSVVAGILYMKRRRERERERERERGERYLKN
jgi:hypothetical protein